MYNNDYYDMVIEMEENPSIGPPNKSVQNRLSSSQPDSMASVVKSSAIKSPSNAPKTNDVQSTFILKF